MDIMKSKKIVLILICYLICISGIPGHAGVFKFLNKNNKIRRVINCTSELSGYSDLTYKPPETVSDTIQMFAKNKQGKDVFLKIYSNSEPLDIEGTIYNNHVKYLREKNITPNLVEGVDFFMCNDDSSTVKNKLVELAKLSSVQSGRLDKILLNDQPISFIVTERIGTADKAPETLKSYMHNLRFVNEDDTEKTVQDVSAVFFQIFFTYDIMRKIGIFHGDLHSKNILLEDKPIDAIYESKDGARYHIKSNYTVKIFDFDHSSVIKDLSKMDHRLFSITCATCTHPREIKYEENGFEKTGFSGMEYNIEDVFSVAMPWLQPDFLRIKNILIYGSGKNKEGKFRDKAHEKETSDFSSRLKKLVSPTEQLKSDYQGI